MPELEPITVTISEFVRLSGIGRSVVYEMLADGRLEGIKLGAKRLIVLASYRELVRRKLAEGGDAER